MQIGVVFPQIDMGADRQEVRAYVEGVESAGFRHVLAYDHVVGADPEAHAPWSGAYDYLDTFHEPMVLFGFIAGISQLEPVTGVLILTQRQTTLVAKQAAEIDILSGGRLRLGVGIGWNDVEYEALGVPFEQRGRRLTEQVALLRRLWTEPLVDYVGSYHRITAAGIAPLPIQRPIPIWMGARSGSPALRRVGRLADGWIPLAKPGPDLTASAEVVRAAAREAGRDPAAIGIEGRVDVGDGDLSRIAEECEGWREIGASHVSFNTMRAGLRGVDAHLQALRAALDVVAP